MTSRLIACSVLCFVQKSAWWKCAFSPHKSTTTSSVIAEQRIRRRTKKTSTRKLENSTSMRHDLGQWTPLSVGALVIKRRLSTPVTRYRSRHDEVDAETLHLCKWAELNWFKLSKDICFVNSNLLQLSFSLEWEWLKYFETFSVFTHPSFFFVI